MELYVLSQSYVSQSIPEFNSVSCTILISILLICTGQVAQNVGRKASAAKEYACINFVVCNGEIPGARFLPVSCTIGEASIPSGIIIISCGVFPIFAEYVELLNRNGQIYAIEFRICNSIIFVIMALELNVISAQFCKVEVISSFCKIEICRFQASEVALSSCVAIIVTSIELTKASCKGQFAIIVSNLSSIVTSSIAIEPATLITENDRLTAKTYRYIFAKVMIYKNLSHRCGSSLVTFEIHVGIKTTLYISGIINLTLYIDTHTAVPAISSIFIAEILVTHTSIAGPVNVAHFLFQVGNANAQVSQFVSVFASQFVEGCTLFSVQLVFFSHEAGNDLSQFITGNVSFTFEGAIRIAFYNALVGEVGYCLVSPVISGNIGEWICCESGNASSECCSSSDCENLFHSSSLL